MARRDSFLIAIGGDFTLDKLAGSSMAGPKLGFLVASVMVALYVDNIVFLAVMNAAMLVICLLFSDAFREILFVVKRIAIGFPFLLLIYILSAWYKAETPAVAVVGGFLGAAVFILKIHFALWANLFLVRTTEPRHLVLALRKLRVPREPCVMIVIILRFFPVMFEESMAVYHAQRARGFEVRRALNPTKWLPLAVPLVVNVIKKSHELAIALELKGIFAVRKSV
jgi:energy-coupling factor transporter transmembrane protein EcfT